MDLSNQGLTYIFLVIPTLVALAVTGQGVFKLTKNQTGGGVILTFGVVFLGLVLAAYFLFIR